MKKVVIIIIIVLLILLLLSIFIKDSDGTSYFKKFTEKVSSFFKGTGNVVEEKEQPRKTGGTFSIT